MILNNRISLGTNPLITLRQHMVNTDIGLPSQRLSGAKELWEKMLLPEQCVPGIFVCEQHIL